MPAKSAMNVSLTPELTRFVSAKVATGHYRTASEVVRTALRLLDQQDRRDGSSNGSAAPAEDRRDAR